MSDTNMSDSALNQDQPQARAQIREQFAFLLNLTAAITQQNRNQQQPNNISPQIASITSGPFTATVIQAALDLNNFLSEKSGPLPASKASIEAMPRIAVTESENEDCVICLDGFLVGSEARQMPCKHKFHSGCIEKWLEIHGSCPVCRFVMPSSSDGGEGGGDGRERRRVTVSFMFLAGGSGGGGGGGGGGDGSGDSNSGSGQETQVDDSSST